MDAPLSLDTLLDEIADGLARGARVPFLGPEAPLLGGANAALPLTPEALVALLAKRVAVPSRIRRNLTAAAQYIENFRHRKVLRGLMRDAFAAPAEPTALHRLLAGLSLPLIVDTGYEAAMAAALAGRSDWGQIQGVSRADVRSDTWTAAFAADGIAVAESLAADWPTLLYKPQGSVSPDANFLVSDSDYVEVLTEIDIQTPIPAEVQRRRSGRPFVFLGCRFSDQLARTWARQIAKRSGDGHIVVLDAAPTRNEAAFIEEIGAAVLPLPLAGFVAAMAQRIPS
jgi:hypothetical protein